MLRAAGHDVETPYDVEPSLAGADDQWHFEHAKLTGRILMTFNVKDFVALHKQDCNRPGLFVIYQQNDASKDMSPTDIVAAVANVETAFESLLGQFLALNHFQW
jgi:hypothetical protein